MADDAGLAALFASAAISPPALVVVLRAFGSEAAATAKAARRGVAAGGAAIAGEAVSGAGSTATAGGVLDAAMLIPSDGSTKA